jgi:hypothetical protein
VQVLCPAKIQESEHTTVLFSAEATLAALGLRRTSAKFNYFQLASTRFSTSIPNGDGHMNWSVTVPSTVSSDTEPTIVLNFDSAKYIFNAGENTNRAFLQSVHGWRKARSIFLTSVGTQRASGLAGQLAFRP